MIYETFRDVKREYGISWSESAVLDNYGTDEERQAARKLDTEKCWQELVDDPNWDPDTWEGGFGFLDPSNYRYYLAAAMVRQRNGPWEWSLDVRLADKESSEYKQWQWSELTPQEIQCVCEFLKCWHKIELETHYDNYDQDDPPATTWSCAYHSHWVKFDANPMQEGKGEPYQ